MHLLWGAHCVPRLWAQGSAMGVRRDGNAALAVPCSAMQCHTVRYSAMQCHTVPYGRVRGARHARPTARSAAPAIRPSPSDPLLVPPSSSHTLRARTHDASRGATSAAAAAAAAAASPPLGGAAGAAGAASAASGCCESRSDAQEARSVAVEPG